MVQSEAAIEAGFEKLRAMKESRLFRPILKRIEHVRAIPFYPLRAVLWSFAALSSTPRPAE